MRWWQRRFRQGETATSAADLGGIDKRLEAGKDEGTLNDDRPAAGLGQLRGQIMDDFTTKYGIKIITDQPDATASHEITTAKQRQGTGRSPTSFDLGTGRRPGQPRHVRAVPVGDVGGHPGQPQGRRRPWINDYTGYMSIGYDTRKVETLTTVARPAGPQVQGHDRPQRRPTQGVRAASTAS